MAERVKRRFRWQWLAVAAVWLVVWQVAYWLIGLDLYLASPLQVGASLLRLVQTGTFWLAALFSLLRILAGCAAGLLVGTLLAIATVSVKWLEAFFRPAISAIRATPVASFILLAILWLNTRAVVFIVFLMVMPIIWANVAEGIRKADPQLLEMASVFKLTRGQIVRLIYLPSVSPFFIAAVTTSIGLGWKAGIAAEVLSMPPLSLGGRLYDAKIYLETADLMALTLVIIILSLILEKLVLLLLRHAQAYFQKHGRGGQT